MNPQYLLDTNLLSEPLRPVPNSRVLQKLRIHQNKIATATVVWHELLYGCYRLPESRKRRAIEEYLQTVLWTTVPILSYDAPAARWHAMERARLEALGTKPPFVDGQIAAIAVVNNLILVTTNTKDFSSFADLEIQNWHT